MPVAPSSRPPLRRPDRKDSGASTTIRFFCIVSSIFILSCLVRQSHPRATPETLQEKNNRLDLFGNIRPGRQSAEAVPTTYGLRSYQTHTGIGKTSRAPAPLRYQLTRSLPLISPGCLRQSPERLPSPPGCLPGQTFHLPIVPRSAIARVLAMCPYHMTRDGSPSRPSNLLGAGRPYRAIGGDGCSGGDESPSVEWDESAWGFRGFA